MPWSWFKRTLSKISRTVKTPPRWANALLGGGGKQKKIAVFFLISFFCFTSAFSLKGYQELQKNTLSFSQAPKPSKVAEEGDLPEKIIIPKVKIDLPVFPAKVVDNQWEVSQEGVSYLLGTSIPGREGNVVIYGHNKNSLFGPIRWLEKDDQMTVVNKKREEFIYKIAETKTVSPEMIEVLAPTEDATLTLYTCTGFLDKDRFVVIAKLHLE